MEKSNEDKKFLCLAYGRGKFVYAYGHDANILNYLCNYKIFRGHKCGFPVSALGKIISLLENNKISYKVIMDSDGSIRESNDFKNLSKYEYFLENSEKNIEVIYFLNDIIKLLEQCDEEKLKEILLEMKKWLK